MSHEISNTSEYRDTHNASFTTDDDDNEIDLQQDDSDEEQHIINVTPTATEIQEVRDVIAAHLPPVNVGNTAQNLNQLAQIQQLADGQHHHLPDSPPTDIVHNDIGNPNQTPTQNDRMEDLAQQMKTLQITTDTPQIKYLQHDEQITKIQNLEIAENQARAEYKSELATVLDLLLKKDDGAIKDYIQKLEEEKDKHIDKSKSIVQGVLAANKVAKKYRSSLHTPTIAQPPDRAQLNPQRTSPREIITVTGKFHPTDPKADFNQMWNKLTAYGRLNYFEENDYITALTYILDGDAYDALTSMTEEDQSLTYIVDYFAKVYGRKRSINKDRMAVDNFTRMKDEPLHICMTRSLIAIDRLKHLHSPEAWPEVRDILRRNILTQMISDKTKRHIQIEENKILEKTGLHIEIDKLIDIAQEFEMFNGEIPQREVSTIFKAASGGFTEDIASMRQELQHFRKSKNSQKNQISDIVQDLITNPARLYKNEGKTNDQKERRRYDSSSSQRTARRDSFDRNRNITEDTSNIPNRVTYRKPEHPQRPPSLQRREARPSVRSPSPYIPPRPSQTTQVEEKPYQNRQNNRSYSRDRYQGYDRGRSPFRSDRRPSGFRTSQSRSYDRSRNNIGQRQWSRNRRPYSNDRGRSQSREERNRYRADSTYRYRNNQTSYRRSSRDRSDTRVADTRGFNKSVLVHINKAEPENGKDPSHQ